MCAFGVYLSLNMLFSLEQPLSDGCCPPFRSCSSVCPGRGRWRLAVRVLRSGSPWCCATLSPTPRTPPRHHSCHRGRLNCSMAILTPQRPHKVNFVSSLVPPPHHGSVSACLLVVSYFCLLCCGHRSGGCAVVS